MSKPASYWNKVSTKFETRARCVFALLSIVIFLGIIAFFNFYKQLFDWTKCSSRFDVN
ncbi:hypothetical protein ACWONS_004136 [Vibrio parahaemolyticus]